MRCTICKKGEIKPGNVNITLKRYGMAFLFKEVPALVCSNCGYKHVNKRTASRLKKIAEESVSCMYSDYSTDVFSTSHIDPRPENVLEGSDML